MMKKSLLVLMSLIGLSGGLALASCGNNNAPKKEVVSFNEMYSTSAITGINILNTNNQLKRAKALTDSEKNKVIENYKIVEGIISDAITKTEESQSDRAEYETMYSITITNLDGSKEIYKYYYNELTEEEFNKKAMPINDEKEESEDKESEETEFESHLKGIVIMNDKEYEMQGSKEIEKEDNELEVELSFEIVDPETNEKVVIVSETENEDNETEEEFKFTKYDAKGRKVYEKEMEVENEDGELEYELVEMINGVKTGYSYEIMTDKDGNKYVEAEIREDKNIIKAEFKVVKDNEGNISYEFLTDTDDNEDAEKPTK